MPTTLSTQAEQRDGIEVLLVSGEVDLFTAEQLGQALESAVQPAAPLIVDLSRVGFLDSAGVRALMVAEGKAAACGSRLLLVPSEAVSRVFEIAGLNPALRLYPTAAEAVAAAHG
jgi:anti-sigma B factor antagonist